MGMSALKPNRTMPTWRGLMSRRPWKDGSDVSKHNDSGLAAQLADSIIFRELARDTIKVSEIPTMWPAAFRGVLSELNRQWWLVNIAHYSPAAN
jgi:hypothetical protein